MFDRASDVLGAEQVRRRLGGAVVGAGEPGRVCYLDPGGPVQACSEARAARRAISRACLTVLVAT